MSNNRYNKQKSFNKTFEKDQDENFDFEEKGKKQKEEAVNVLNKLKLYKKNLKILYSEIYFNKDSITLMKNKIKEFNFKLF